jgi:CRISPR-associated protein Cas2
MKNWYLVGYDVRDDARLRRVARIMEGYGERVQYSVFRCHLSDRSVEHMRWRLSQVMQPDDGLIIAGLCAACLKRLRQKDSRKNWPEDPPGWVTL